MKKQTVVSLIGAIVATIILSSGAAAQAPIEQQISEAVTPLRPADRDGATVLGYVSGTTLEVVREGTNQYICLADPPDDTVFRVTCYHESLDPFIGRGREIRAAGGSGGDVRRIRKEEVEAGQLTVPERALLITLSGTRGPDGAAPDSVTSLNVIYLPYATAEDLGVAITPQGTDPWLMDPGQHRAHVMIPGPLRPLQ